MARQIAISDIHGCGNTLERLLNRLQLTTHDSLYLLGDFIDRGPNSRKVFALLDELDLQKCVCLKGNHEDMAIKALTDSNAHSMWMQHGGVAVLESYGVHHIDLLPQSLWKRIDAFEYHHDTANYVMVHAGLNTSLGEQMFDDKHAMMWQRHTSFEDDPLKGKQLLSGHTPHPL